MTAYTASTDQQNLVLADLLPGSRLRDAVLVLGGTAFVTVMAQAAIPLPFTPVPLSLATFAVLLTGAALGPLRGGLSLGIYLVAGMAGAPLFADRSSGWQFASFGYIVGYIAAAAFLGLLARRWKVDRSPWRTITGSLAATSLVYVFGVPWLMNFLNISLAEAMPLGVTPFLVGDVLKAIAAALLLPTAWRLVDRPSGRKSESP